MEYRKVMEVRKEGRIWSIGRLYFIELGRAWSVGR